LSSSVLFVNLLSDMNGFIRLVRISHSRIGGN